MHLTVRCSAHSRMEERISNSASQRRKCKLTFSKEVMDTQLVNSVLHPLSSAVSWRTINTGNFHCTPESLSALWWGHSAQRGGPVLQYSLSKSWACLYCKCEDCSHLFPPFIHFLDDGPWLWSPRKNCYEPCQQPPQTEIRVVFLTRGITGRKKGTNTSHFVTTEKSPLQRPPWSFKQQRAS